MTTMSYKHLIEIDENHNSLSIYRIYEDGEKELYTSTKLPEINAQNEWDKFELFSKQLGENILMDSPLARKILSL